MSDCNACTNETLRQQLGKRYLLLTPAHGCPTVYEIGAEPWPGQAEPHQHNGQPIRLHASFLACAEHTYDEDCRRRRPNRNVAAR